MPSLIPLLPPIGVTFLVLAFLLWISHRGDRSQHTFTFAVLFLLSGAVTMGSILWVGVRLLNWMGELK